MLTNNLWVFVGCIHSSVQSFLSLSTCEPKAFKYIVALE